MEKEREQRWISRKIKKIDEYGEREKRDGYVERERKKRDRCTVKRDRYEVNTI